MERVSLSCWLSGLALGWAALSCGCDDGGKQAAAVDAPYRAAKPLHPAMSAPVAESGQSPEGGLNSRMQGSSTTAAPLPPQGGSGGLAVGLARAGLAADIPPAWIEQPSTSAMRLATIRLPRIEGDTKDGEMSVIQLPGEAGGLQANVTRWEGQFQEKPKAKTESIQTAGGVKVTTVEIQGTFSPGGGPMMRSSGDPISGALLLGAIVELPSGAGLLFFKSWGPKTTMEHWRESFDGFVQSLRTAQ
jgi:hypothetical protein